MAIDFLYPQYEVVRDQTRCIACRACERQCANEVHAYDERGEIGSGVHERFIIHAEKFMAKTQSKLEG